MIFWQGHLCPGLHAITNLTILRRFATKNRGRNAFSRFTILPYFFLFLTYHVQGASEFNKFCENCEKSRPQRFFALNHFLFLFGLFHLPDGASEFNKFCGNCVKSWSQRLVALYDFSLLPCCSHLPERASKFN